MLATNTFVEAVAEKRFIWNFTKYAKRLNLHQQK